LAGGRVKAAKERYEKGVLSDLWRRLVAVDFMNQAFVLAALLMLCVVPFMMLVSAVKGVDYVDNVSRHMALDDAASQDVRALFGPHSGTLASVTVLSLIGLALFAISVGAVVKSFYLQVFTVDTSEATGIWRVPVWVAVALAGSSGAFAVNNWLEDARGGNILVVVFDVLVMVCFWWWSMHFLLAGRRTWQYLLPAALSTTLFWIGLRVFSSFGFSSAIVANEKKYGPIGVVFILMYFLIAVGVVILLGAVVGVVWEERRSAHREASA
jgi:membrane protein